MGNFKIGDIVYTNTYGSSILFRIINIEDHINGKKIFELSGIIHRVSVQSTESDLNYTNDVIIKNYQITGLSHKDEPKKIFNRTKILHIDSDKEFANSAKNYYKEIGVLSNIEIVSEYKLPQIIYDLLKKYKPDILAITGHDGFRIDKNDYLDINNYTNSKYFVEAVSEARKFENNKDKMVIFAGAARSCYEKIISAGANFASSPKRVLIHSLDPAIVCGKIALTKNNIILSPNEISKVTITGSSGVSGIPTRGKLI
jgi:spore coat assembly protein